MKEIKIDMENVRFALERINATFALVMDDMEKEPQDAEGYAELFYNRTNKVYLPALDLLQGSIHELLKQVEALV